MNVMGIYIRNAAYEIVLFPSESALLMMEELHTDSIDGGHEGQLWARSRARERAYSNN
jgi:hypothetical protein